jgi:hypothetical protein
VEAGRGGSRDFLRGGGGLEAAPHRVRVHVRRRAGPARRGGRTTTRQTKRALEFPSARQADKTSGGGAAWVLPRLTGGARNAYLVVGSASGSSSFFLRLFIKNKNKKCTCGACWALMFDPTFDVLLETCINHLQSSRYPIFRMVKRRLYSSMKTTITSNRETSICLNWESQTTECWLGTAMALFNSVLLLWLTTHKR